MSGSVPTQRKSRNTGMTEGAIARVLRAAVKAGMDVGEVIATKDGIRLRIGPGGSSRSVNTWDEVLDDE